MKAANKVMTFLAAVGLSTVSLGSVAAADEGIPNESQVEEEQQADENETLQLTIDDVVSKALENNNNLVIMKAEYAKLKSETTGAKNDFRDMKDALDDLWDMRDNLSGRDRIENSNAIQELDDSVKALEKQLLQLENSLAVSEISEEQMKTGLRFQTKSRYVRLLTAQEQIDFAKQHINKLERDLRAEQVRNQYGVGTEADIRDIEQELRTARTELEQQEEEYELDVKKLLLDINVPLQANVEFAPVTLDEIAPVDKPEDITPLIENAFAMQQAEKALELAKDELEHVESYDQRGKEQAEQEVFIKKEEIKQLDTDLRNEIDTLYHDINDAYRSVTKAENDLAKAREDYEQMKISYESGVLSKLDYENGELLVEQAEMELSLAKKKYFTLQQQLEAMENGLVQMRGMENGSA